jgi:hypothetical protein
VAAFISQCSVARSPEMALWPFSRDHLSKLRCVNVSSLSKNRPDGDPPLYEFPPTFTRYNPFEPEVKDLALKCIKCPPPLCL